MNTPRVLWVHGMGKKPPPEEERAGAWRAVESSLWIPVPEDAFDVAYWADLREPPSGNGHVPPGEFLMDAPAPHRAALEFCYVTDLTGSARDKSLGEALLSVPQRKGLMRSIRGLREYVGKPHVLAINAAEGMMQGLDALRKRLSWPTQQRMLRALMYLYRDMQPYLRGITREPIMQRITGQLRAPADRPICLVSQSMGTVVALDAIYHNPDVQIDTFVTLGSPLGIRFFREKLWGAPAFPANVRRWYNLYDTIDNVAIWDRDLCDDYPTAAGERKVIDVTIRDNYNRDGLRDPHDWYAYLSSPQLADVMCHFWLGASGLSAAVANGLQPPESATAQLS